MTARVVDIWRHPLKSHGREAVARTTLISGATMPWDRAWAVTLETAKIDHNNPAWAPCVNFARGSKNPALMAINAKFDEQSLTLTLTHPKMRPLSFCPDDNGDTPRFLAWIDALNDPKKSRPNGIVRVAGRGMTDTDYPSVSINSLASLKSLGTACGTILSPLRWRGNFWIDGVVAWDELNWIGREVRLGSAKLRIREPIRRCLATTANPDTGVRDADTLGALNRHWNHQNFGVYAEVIEGGNVAREDRLELVDD